jgi:Cys-rich four helix bundle protein (predicted Tat secretion target)
MSRIQQTTETEIDTKTAGPAPMARRELLASAGALAGMALAGSAWAGSHEGASGHAGHAAAKYSEPVAARAHPKLVAAANECTRTGRICFSHCLETFRGGDTTMADCAWSVEQMMHVCEAFSTLASYDSPHLEDLAAVCAKICEDCEKECRVHEKHQRECGDCADACAALIEEIRALSA